MRVAIAGITHEALGSSPIMTGLDDLRVLRGLALLGPPAVDGLDGVAAELGVELVPILTATHIAPGGTVELGAYLGLRHKSASSRRDAVDRSGPPGEGGQRVAPRTRRAVILPCTREAACPFRLAPPGRGRAAARVRGDAQG